MHDVNWRRSARECRSNGRPLTWRLTVTRCRVDTFSESELPLAYTKHVNVNRYPLSVVYSAAKGNKISPPIFSNYHARSQGGSTGSIEPPQPEPRPTMVAIIRTTIVPSRYLFLNLTDYFGVCPLGGLNNDNIGECRSFRPSRSSSSSSSQNFYGAFYKV